MNTMRVGARIALAAAAVAATGALVAPLATADIGYVGDIAVSGDNHKVDCTYTLTAKIGGVFTRGTPVHFTDNGTELPGSPVAASVIATTVTLKWTPKTAGSHKLVARQLLLSDSVTVNVAPAAESTGSAGGCGSGPAGFLPSFSG